MVKPQIEDLKAELNHLIGRGADLADVYELSVELDKLILQYYKERQIIEQ